MSLEEKVILLGLKKVEESSDEEIIETAEEKGFSFYKDYNGTIMYYTESYIERNDILHLQLKDEENKKIY